MPLPEVESTRPASGEEPVLRAVDVSVRFGGVVALNGVNLDARPGEVLGLIGPNGAGKTTLFDVLSGIRPPTSGRIVFYEGVDITKRSPTWRSRHGIRRTFQRQQMFGWLTVEENVLVALEWRGGGGGLVADLVALPTRRRRERDRRRQADEVLELCGLVDVRTQPAGKLPIGRARMVEMARAIVDEPKCAAPRRADLGPRGVRIAQPRGVDAARAAVSGRARCSSSSTTSGS